ncbi:uncharacterized protein LOC119737101 [Patiria miniata]|uniref:Uncharacterized protein n=1 Tax=Patiria miniata TaxID=46514 RepID=A0A914ATX4_PATMI|nr:uncharacterized protein LOC119737101 [Patiria miniata]
MAGTWLGCASLLGAETRYQCPADDSVFYNRPGNFSGFWDWPQAVFDDSNSLQVSYCLFMEGPTDQYTVTKALCKSTRDGQVMCERALQATTATPAPVENSAKVCYVLGEPDPDSDDQPRHRWFVPQPDPCACTEVRMGGLNARPVAKPFAVQFMDSVLVSEDQEEISSWLGCGGMTADDVTQEPI